MGFHFHQLTLADRELVVKYTWHFGEGSCQHNFANLFCLNNKYGHQICEWKDSLFIKREHLSDDVYNTFLFPLGNGNLYEAIEKLREESKLQGKKIRFSTITESAKNRLVESYGDLFEVKECRDYAEYIYRTEKLIHLCGSNLSSKRYDERTFWRHYHGHVTIKLLSEGTSEDVFEDIIHFQNIWYQKHSNQENQPALKLEHESIMLALQNFQRLDLSGIAVYIDGRICGYAYGTVISPLHFNVMIEKGKREFADIYRVLNKEIARRCSREMLYINREEDLGIAGLRQAKLSYHPDLLMKKFEVQEVISI